MKTEQLYDSSPYEREFTGSVIATSDNRIALDTTLFYPTGGGQPGDTGVLKIAEQSSLTVIETIRDKDNPQLIWHLIEDQCQLPLTGDVIHGEINWDTRYKYMRMHTCLHLLCATIPAPVTGCSIGVNKGRLDFDMPESTWTKDDVSGSLMALIEADKPVSSYWCSSSDPIISDMTRTMRLPPAFDGKVRIVNVESIDIQPCGGTHVARTGEVGEILCNKISKKSAHNRRFSIELCT